jgi:hypothetical protein
VRVGRWGGPLWFGKMKYHSASAHIFISFGPLCCSITPRVVPNLRQLSVPATLRRAVRGWRVPQALVNLFVCSACSVTEAGVCPRCYSHHSCLQLVSRCVQSRPQPCDQRAGRRPALGAVVHPHPRARTHVGPLSVSVGSLEGPCAMLLTAARQPVRTPCCAVDVCLRHPCPRPRRLQRQRFPP